MPAPGEPLIDPMISLAYSMHTNPRVYALLIGSGVSRSASIPTGWEIVEDLIRKVATLEDEDCEPSPAKWYQAKYGAEPDYSKLLDAIAKTPEERQQLLSGYFEPTEDEREQNLKLPTDAHRGIAKIVASGHIRVILTTNFDRLLERAIEDEGVTPVVLSTTDTIKGAIPLVHQRCCIIKIHGDYLDPRIKNTIAELAEYDEETNRILDRVFDEFGLVVCGWSGQWDPALRASIERCKTRRFSTFWAARGELTQKAQCLLASRLGGGIQIRDADTFFTELAEKVATLDELSKCHPLSVAVATTTTKRLLAEEKHLIRLHDLVTQETEKAQKLIHPLLSNLYGTVSEERLTEMLRQICTSLEILRAISVTGAYWSSVKQFRSFTQIPVRVTPTDNMRKSGYQIDEGILVIPGSIMLYTMGLSSLAAKNYQTLAQILTVPSLRMSDDMTPFLQIFCWSNSDKFFRVLTDFKQKYFPTSEWLFLNCKSHLGDTISDDSEYDAIFDEFEIIRSLVHIDLQNKGGYIESPEGLSAPGGRFVWKSNRLRGENLLDNVKKQNELCERLCEAGLFGGKLERLQKAIEGFRPTLNRMAGRCL